MSVAEAIGQYPVARVVTARACDVEIRSLAARLKVLAALRAKSMQDSKFGIVASCGLEHGFEFHYARADHVPLAHSVPSGGQEAIDEVGDEDVCEQFPGRDVPVAAVLAFDVEYADLGSLGIESVHLGNDYIPYLR